MSSGHHEARVMVAKGQFVCHSQFRSPWLGVQFPGSSLKLVTRLPDTSRGRAASDSIREELSLSWLRAWDRDESYNMLALKDSPVYWGGKYDIAQIWVNIYVVTGRPWASYLIGLYLSFFS